MDESNSEEYIDSELTPEEDIIIKKPDTTYFMQVDGVRYTLPFKFSELERVGFDLSEYEDMMIEPNGSKHEVFWKNGLRYYLSFENPTGGEVKAGDCLVCFMELDAIDYEKSDVTILEGIKYGTGGTFIKELLDVYGGIVSELDNEELIYNIAYYEYPVKGYKIWIDAKGFVDYFAVYNYDISTIYSISETNTLSDIQLLVHADKSIPSEPASWNFVIDWNDDSLEAYMRECTKIKEGDIWYSDVQHITSLMLADSGITDISALGYLENITTLNLGFNNIEDFSVLSRLKNLERLYIRCCELTDITMLNKLKNLTELDLSYNNISDVSPLSELTNLKKLELTNNDISDISMLDKLTSLEELYLHSNKPIDDISVLSNMPLLSTLTLTKSENADYSIVELVPEVNIY